MDMEDKLLKKMPVAIKSTKEEPTSVISNLFGEYEGHTFGNHFI